MGSSSASSAFDVAEDNAALEHVAGYAIALDMTVRSGPKTAASASPIDSYAVLASVEDRSTADEMPNPLDESFSLSVNGTQRQASSTKHMIYDIPTLIGWASALVHALSG